MNYSGSRLQHIYIPSYTQLYATSLYLYIYVTRVGPHGTLPAYGYDYHHCHAWQCLSSTSPTSTKFDRRCRHLYSTTSGSKSHPPTLTPQPTIQTSYIITISPAPPYMRAVQHTTIRRYLRYKQYKQVLPTAYHIIHHTTFNITLPTSIKMQHPTSRTHSTSTLAGHTGQPLEDIESYIKDYTKDRHFVVRKR